MDACEVEESVGMEHQDRLSELPVSLILLILSFLPMRDVVSTTFLSKHWKNLWTTVPCLNLCNLGREEEGVWNFVNSALKLWKGTKLQEFKFSFFSHFDMSLASDVDWWVQFAVENKVEVLEIRLWYDREKVELAWRDPVMTGKKGVYRAPLCLNSCSSITELWLAGCNLRIRGLPAWDQLKSLRIDGCFSERTINRILYGSPCLEVFELRLLEKYENLNIRSRSLRKLTIEKHIHFYADDPSMDAVLRICCPNLETLEISGVVYPKYLFTNVSSVTNVSLLGFEEPLYMNTPEIELLGERLRHILPTIQQVLGASQKKYLLSPLPNVKFLKLDVRSKGIGDIEFRDMMKLLAIFPNLKTLVIKDQPWIFDLKGPTFDEDECSDSEFGTDISKFFLVQLKTIQITSDLSNSSILRIIEFLLKHTSKLEKMEIRTHRYMSYQEKILAERESKILLSMPRSSPTAKVLGASQKKYLLSPLPNVETLKLTVHSKEIGNVEFCDLMNLLGIFPNLKMLVIEDPPCLCDMNQPTFDEEEYSEFGTNLSESYLVHLRTIQITSAFYSSSILGIVEFLLKHASKLKKLVIGARWCMSYRETCFAERMLNIPKSSQTPKVIVNTD